MSVHILPAYHVDTFEEDLPSLGELFFNQAKKHGNKIAQIQGETGETVTYDALLLQSIRVAQHMINLGIQQKDVICLCSYNNLQISLPVIASQFLGAQICSLDPTLSCLDCEHLLKLVEPKLMFCDEDSLKLIETTLGNIGLKTPVIVLGNTNKHIKFDTFLTPTGTEANFEVTKVNIFDTAVIFFSSGTTGLPKGICANHYGLISQQKYFGNGHDASVLLYLTTFYWISAVMLLTLSFLEGSARVLCKKPNVKFIMEVIQKHKVSLWFISPTFAKRILQNIDLNQYDTTSLKSLFIGGERVYENQTKDFRKAFKYSDVYIVYGMTEASGCLTMISPKEKHLLNTKTVTVGKQVPGISYKIVNPETKEICGPNVEGELMVKGKCLMNGYYNNPQATKDVWDSDGYMHTGDIACYDEDKCFYIVDRIKEMLKYQSWHIVPGEIENILLQHPDVKESVVVGIPHNLDGEHPMAVVVLKSGHKAKAEDILQFVNGQIPERKKLRAGLKFVDQIPLTPTGKVRRRELRNMFLK